MSHKHDKHHKKKLPTPLITPFYDCILQAFSVTLFLRFDITYFHREQERVITSYLLFDRPTLDNVLKKSKNHVKCMYFPL